MKFIPCPWTLLHNKCVRVSRKIVLGYKGVGGGERKGRDVNVSYIFGYGYSEILEKLDGIANEESECAILVLENLVTIYCKEVAYSLSSASLKSSKLKWRLTLSPSAPEDS